MIYRLKLAEIIKNSRKKKGYSQRKLAMVSGVSNSTISRIENASSDTDPETLKKIAPALDVQYNDLMKAAGYLKTYGDITEETLEDEDFDRILPLILKHLTENILKHDDKENESLTRNLDLTKNWNYLDKSDKVELLNSIIKEAKYDKATGGVSLVKYFDISEEGFHTIKKDYLDFLAEQEREEEGEDNEIDVVDEFLLDLKKRAIERGIEFDENSAEDLLDLYEFIKNRDKKSN